jgi:hypothetical protein
MGTAELVLTELRAHFDELRGAVHDCVRQHGTNEKVLKADLALTGDPDIGALIDASGIVGADGAPVSARLDDCIRGALQSLALPPIHSGDGYTVNLEFEL